MKLGILNEKLRQLSKVRSEYILLAPGIIAASDDTFEVRLNVEHSLDFMIPSKSLALLALESDDAELKKEGDKVSAGKTTINILSSTFYKGVYLSDVTDTFPVNSEVLKTALAKTHYIANGDSNPLFEGINWRPGVVVSTDQKSISAFKLPTKIQEPIIIPKQIFPLLQIFNQETLTVKTNGRVLEITGKSGTILSRLLEGKYPEIMKYVEPVKEYTEVPREEFLQAVRKCLAVQGMETEDRLQTLLTFRGKELVISARGAIGEVEEVIQLTTPLEAQQHFNTKALVTIASNLKSVITRLYLERGLYISDSTQEVVLLLPIRNINT